MWGGVWVHRGLVWGRVLRKNTNQTLTWDGERERERASTQGNVPHSGYCSTLRVLLHTQGIAPHSGYCSTLRVLLHGNWESGFYRGNNDAPLPQNDPW